MQEQVLSTRHGCWLGVGVRDRGGLSGVPCPWPRQGKWDAPCNWSWWTNIILSGSTSSSTIWIPSGPWTLGFHGDYCIAAWNRLEIDSFQLYCLHLDSLSSTRPYRILQSIATIREFMVKWDTRYYAGQIQSIVQRLWFLLLKRQ